MAAILLLFTATIASAQRKVDYFTDAEVDYLRDAQEPLARIRTYMKFADNRLLVLGAKEQTAKEKDQEVRDRKKYEQDAKDAKKNGADAPLAPLDAAVYLKNFSRSELLRGYMQALDEAMDNIDSYYEQKLDVRGALEEFTKYTADRLPTLKSLKTQSNVEAAALKDALELTGKAHDDAVGALQIVPKTERKNAKP